jgi:hypothetical protein
VAVAAAFDEATVDLVPMPSLQGDLPAGRRSAADVAAAPPARR